MTTKTNLRLLTLEQIEWCNRYLDFFWTISNRGKIVSPGNIAFKYRAIDEVEEFLVKFEDTESSFNCGGLINLKSLEGSPDKCGDFYCISLKSIKNLEGAPREILGVFDCSGSNVNSLKGSPKFIEGDFVCRKTNISDLNGICQYIGGDIVLNDCKELKSLDGIQKEVENLYLKDCSKLESLKNGPKIATVLQISGTAVKTLIDAPEIRFRIGMNDSEKLQDEWERFMIEEKDQDLLKRWLSAKPRKTAKEFLEEKRGIVHGKKFGL